MLWNPTSPEGRNSPLDEMSHALSMRSEGNTPLSIQSPQYIVDASSRALYAGCPGGTRCPQRVEMRLRRLIFAPSASGFAIVSPRQADPPRRLPLRYSLVRTALNVPCFVGLSPTSGEKLTSPVIKSGVSNFPLHVNVPTSRPTLPRRNSTLPENVTEFP